MAESRRYGGLKLRDFVNRIEPENEKQFAAVTVLLPGGGFIAYRGTDNTLVGWNEGTHCRRFVDTFAKFQVFWQKCQHSCKKV